jgi:hypothetical protein
MGNVKTPSCVRCFHTRRRGQNGLSLVRYILQYGYIYGSGLLKNFIFFSLYVGGLDCIGHSFAYVAHFVFLRDV